MPPKITAALATGFTLFMVKALLNGRADEVVDLAQTKRLALNRPHFFDESGDLVCRGPIFEGSPQIATRRSHLSPAGSNHMSFGRENVAPARGTANAPTRCVGGVVMNSKKPEG